MHKYMKLYTSTEMILQSPVDRAFAVDGFEYNQNGM